MSGGNVPRGDRALLWFAASAPVVAGILFAVPSPAAAEAVSGITVTGLVLALITAQVRAVRRTSGIDRTMWVAFIVTHLVLFTLFSVEDGPTTYLPTREALPTNFGLAPVAGMVQFVGLVVSGRRIIRDTNLWRFAADSAWLSVAALALLAPIAVDPVLALDADRGTIVTIFASGVVVALLAGTLGALILHSRSPSHVPTVETGLGLVVLPLSSAIFFWGWTRNGVTPGSAADLTALACVAAMVWSAVRGPELQPALRGTEPPVRSQLVASWVPVAIITLVLIISRFDVHRYWAAILGLSAILLVARLSSEVQRAAELRRRHRRQATQDPLTGLPNRLVLEQTVTDPATSPTAVLIIDLDRFKAINDQLGQEVGDELLRGVAKRLRAALDDDWLLSRVGGDEFVGVSTTCESAEELAGVGDAVVDCLAPSFTIRGREAWIGVSVGGAAMGAGLESGELRAVAELALRDAKTAGRGAVVIGGRETSRRAGDAADLATGIRQGVEDGQFFCLYQPQVDLTTGALVGVEALVRWNHPQRGLLEPDEFLDVAEATGLIARIDDAVLREASGQLAEWNELAPERRLRLSVNMSAWQLARQDVAADVVRSLAIAGPRIDPARVVVELSESLLIDDPLVIRRRLERLHSTGVAISVDDFGAGFTSVAHLRQFPIDEVKIDRDLIAELDDGDEEAHPVAAAVIALAQALELTVVAEGIETEAQLAALRRLGCRTGQGFLFAHPVPAATITAWLNDAEPFQSQISTLPVPSGTTT